MAPWFDPETGELSQDEDIERGYTEFAAAIEDVRIETARARKEQERFSNTVQRSTVYALWYYRVLQQQIDVVSKLGRELLSTAQGWAYYASQGERAQRMMDRVAELTGGLTVELDRQLDPAVRLGKELGEQLAPYYDAVADASDRMRMAVVNADDSIQAAIATGTLAAGTFLKVSADVALAAVGLASFMKVAESVLPVLGLTGAAVGAFAVGFGAVAAATVLAFATGQRHIAVMEDTSAVLKLTSGSYDEYIAGMLEAYKASGDFRAAMALQNEQVEWGGRVLAMTREEFEKMATAMDSAIEGISAGAILGAASAAAALIPTAAATFGEIARTQESIQNEMLTRQREYEHALAEIEERGGSERAIADLNRRGAELRRLELGLEEAKAASRRALGAIVLQFVAAAVATGRVSFTEGIEMQLDAMQAFGMAGAEDITRGREFMAQAGLFSTGDITWGQMMSRMGWVSTEATTGIMANLPEVGAETVGELGVTAETVELIAGTVTLTVDEAGMAAFGAGAAAYARLMETGVPTLGDEIRTQGVRTR